jgi:4'-phosphopantetheinyl transferase
VNSTVHWAAPPDATSLLPGEIHLWRAGLDMPPSQAEQFLEILSEDERDRADRFRFPKDRWRFVAGRGLLRLILARYLGTLPDRIRFSYGPQGKPSLAGNLDGGALRFNVSHSDALALFAFARDRELGVDLERVDPLVAAERIPEYFFSSQECASLRSLPAEFQPEAFFHCWSRKEAYLKAKGGGLTVPLDQFSVSLAPNQPAELLWTAEPRENCRWSLHALTPAPGYVGALAVEDHACRLLHWQFPDSLGR